MNTNRSQNEHTKILTPIQHPNPRTLQKPDQIEVALRKAAIEPQLRGYQRNSNLSTMKTFKQIENICTDLGIDVEKLPNWQQSCPDAYPKYGLYFEGTKAEKELGQSSYLSFNMKGLNEDFEEVVELIRETA